MIKKTLYTILVFALGAASASGGIFLVNKLEKKQNDGPVTPVVSVETVVDAKEMLSGLSFDELERKALEAEDNGDIEIQRMALCELHKKHPSQEYIDAISNIPVEINDNIPLRLVGQILEYADAGEITTAIDLVNSNEWKEAFVDDLAGVTRISIYNMGQRIIPVAVAGVTPASQRLQIRIEANAYGSMIKYLNGDGTYQYLHLDGTGVDYMKTTIKDNQFDSDFVKETYNLKGESIEKVSGTFKDGKITGELTVDKKDKTQKVKINKDYDIATVLGVEGYTDFTSFAKVQLTKPTLEAFEEKLTETLNEKNEEKVTAAEKEKKESVTDVVSEFSASGTTSASAKPSTSKPAATAQPAKPNTPAPAAPAPSYDDGPDDHDDGPSSAPEPAPAPAPEPEPEPPADTNEESTEQEGSVGGESGFYD